MRKRMAKIFRSLGMLLTVVMLIAVLILSFGCKKEENKPIDTSKPMLPTTEYPDDEPEQPDNTPVDEGELVDHIFEAEAAQFNGVSTNRSVSMGGICMAQSYFFDLSFSGSAIIRNITQTTNKYIFEFESDKAYKCTMEVAVASAYSTTWVDRELSAMYDISINYETLETDVVVPAGNADQVKGGNNYTCIQHVEVPVTIKEGSNLIIMRVLDGVCNLDYINIKTSANITGFTEKWWEDDTVITIDLPTMDAAGTINLACEEHGKSNTFTLPALADGNGYTVSEDGKAFSFPFNGETYTVNTDGTYSFPEHVKVIAEEPEEPDDEVPDPDAEPLPEVIVNGKDFFEPSAWTTFASGEPGAKPIEMNSALKFTDAARFDLFYVNGSTKTVHLGDKVSTLEGQDVYNKDYSWTFDMSSKGTFDMLLFATANLPAVYGQYASAGIYLTFEEDKISVRNAYYGNETPEVIAEAPVSLSLDGETRYKVKVTANRVDSANLSIKIAIDDTELVFIAKSASTAGATVNESTFSVYMSGTTYGQRVAFVPAHNSIVRIYGLTLPE